MSGKPEPKEDQIKRLISMVINDGEIKWRTQPTELELNASMVQAYNAYEVYVVNVLEKGLASFFCAEGACWPNRNSQNKRLLGYDSEKWHSSRFKDRI